MHIYVWKPFTLQTGIVSPNDFASKIWLKEAGFIRVPFRIWKVLNGLARFIWRNR